MPTLHCTEPVCRHTWVERLEPEVPRCPCCGGFWVRVDSAPPRAEVVRLSGAGLVPRPSFPAFR